MHYQHYQIIKDPTDIAGIHTHTHTQTMPNAKIFHKVVIYSAAISKVGKFVTQ